jgi:hypothetical protein
MREIQKVHKFIWFIVLTKISDSLLSHPVNLVFQDTLILDRKDI